MATGLTNIQIRILAAIATLIGFMMFFYIIDHFARKKAIKEVTRFEEQQTRIGYEDKKSKKENRKRIKGRT